MAEASTVALRSGGNGPKTNPGIFLAMKPSTAVLRASADAASAPTERQIVADAFDLEAGSSASAMASFASSARRCMGAELGHHRNRRTRDLEPSVTRWVRCGW